MKRTQFLTIASIIAFAVGIYATIFPKVLLESKGVTPDIGAKIWTTEVGVLLIGIGILVFGIRKMAFSKSLKVILLANAFIQIGLFAIEFIAWINNQITIASGVIPNLSIHILLTIGFIYYSILQKD